MRDGIHAVRLIEPVIGGQQRVTVLFEEAPMEDIGASAADQLNLRRAAAQFCVGWRSDHAYLFNPVYAEAGGICHRRKAVNQVFIDIEAIQREINSSGAISVYI